ncbi:DUF2079 domain-containing protein [Microcoleus sp. FACHB-68]|uniref:DUF2079 domain-containing protein n=1 Tax=Microcoleus sp. FACHB-68 TaxID=2692826 RepID=UPI001685D267|nr:DUF2079 domain-containing protein [Microcoleus sp. FACHB-68]MBD1940508.1 DUF2079 domain-containing protein [Microcoleus sp. FACHB-68]
MLSQNIRSFILTNIKYNAVYWIAGAAAVIFFACSSLRHALFQSGAFDLGIFDQAVYLISQGKPAISSFIGFHILGDHAALILYPLALLYKIYPDVHGLLAVQAVALALGALPAWQLAKLAGLQEKPALAMAGVYLLYPLVFNLNLFDFHPEVIALPALLWAILAARQNQIGWFCLAIALVLSCKAVLALTIVAMGFWLIFFEKKRLFGTIAIAAGVAWFLIATQFIIPFFGSNAASVARHLPRYSYLGNSAPEVLKNVLLQPALILGKIFSLTTLEYLALLVLPVIWWLSPQHLAPLVGAVPTLVLNILSEAATQRNLVQQYSLPVLPFLLLAVISNLAAKEKYPALERQQKNSFFSNFPSVSFLAMRQGSLLSLILWSFLAFLALAKYGYFGSIYLDSLDTWKATRQAIAQIKTEESVLTTHEISPHLSNRQFIKFTDTTSPPANLAEFKYILLNLRDPGWNSSPEFAAGLVTQLKNKPEFKLHYQQDDVYLFIQKDD